jgi:ABC-type sugar transport system permease subunit
MKQKGRTAFIVSFLAPAVLLYAVFVVWPLIDSFYVALHRWRGVSAKRTFVGIENFQKLFEDDVFWKAIKNNFWMLAVGMLAIFLIGLMVAHAMQGGGRLSKGLRSIVLFPQVISMVAVAIVWKFLYNPSFGLVPPALKSAGAGDWADTLLSKSTTALPAVTVAFLWYAVGFYIMLFATGLRAIPEEVVEAAELDGSHGLHRFWRVTWPMLWSVKRTAAVYVVINVMNVFALAYLMTPDGGPDRATEVMLTYLYQQGFTNYEFGYATTLAVANFVVAMLLAGVLMFVFRRNPMEARR